MTSRKPSWRGDKRTSAQRGYGSRWQRARAGFLRKHPLCVMCQKVGRTEAATVVDHIKPHRGDQTLFWDKNNWQALCKRHHDGTKQSQEANNTVKVGLDGVPEGWGE